MNLQLRAPEKEGIQETWCWPLQIDAYDKAPQLTQVEYATLEKLFARSEGHIYPSTKRPLQRIVQPIEDALLHIHAIPVVCRETLRLMLLEMYHRLPTLVCPAVLAPQQEVIRAAASSRACLFAQSAASS